MKRTILIVRGLVSLLGLALVVLGVLFWTGRALGLLPVHMLLGALFVVCLWVLVGLALSARAGATFTLGVFVWSLIVLWLGMMQLRLLPGSRHWIVQVVHLLVGVGVAWACSIGILGGLLPAIRAARMPIAVALRPT